MKRFEFIRKISQCFNYDNLYDNNQVKFKLVVSMYFKDEKDELRQFDLSKFEEIRENLQELINEQHLKDLVALMLLEVSFFDDTYTTVRLKGRFMQTMLKPAITVVKDIVQRLDQSEPSFMDVQQ